MTTKYKRSYNLPEYGTIKYRIFPYAKAIYDYAEEKNYISRLKNIDQLGAIRNVFPGAHHNRFEYVIVQLSLITELCELKGHKPAGFSVTSCNNSEIDSLSFISQKEPSSGDLIQCLILLSNIGHLPNTFADERALLNFLKHNDKCKRKFKEGLKNPKLKYYFDKLLGDFDMYNFHYFLSVFILNRHTRIKNGDKIALFCQDILNSFMRYKYENNSNNDWRLFENIRRLTIIALDSLYSPVQFSINLNSIILSLEQGLKEYFDSKSDFQHTLIRLENLLSDKVYLHPKSILVMSNYSSIKTDLLKEHHKNKEKLNTITEIKNVLTNKNLGVFDFKNHNISLKNTVSNKFRYSPNLSSLLNVEFESINILEKVKHNRIDFESNSQNAISKKHTLFGLEWNYSNTAFKFAGGIKESVPDNKLNKYSLKIAYKLANLSLKTKDNTDRFSVISGHEKENHINIINFLLESFFEDKMKHCRLNQKNSVNFNFTRLERGSTKTANKIRNDLGNLDNVGNNDYLNEIKMVVETLRNIDYEGVVLAFLGSAEILGEENILAEVDGIIFKLSSSGFDKPLIFVEAKNTNPASSSTQAKRHLKDKFSSDKLNINQNKYQLNNLSRGAYASINI